jgi:hypothetical protein
MALPLVLVALLAVEAAIGANAASLSPPRLGVDQLEAEVAAAAIVPTILTALLSDYRFTLTVDPISVVVGTHQCMYTITSGTHWRRGGVGDSPVVVVPGAGCISGSRASGPRVVSGDVPTPTPSGGRQ